MLLCMLLGRVSVEQGWGLLCGRLWFSVRTSNTRIALFPSKFTVGAASIS